MLTKSFSSSVIRYAKQSLFVVLGATVALSLTQCSSQSAGSSPKLRLGQSSKTKAFPRKWDGNEFDRVVGYRFRDLSGWGSVVSNDLGKLDMASLQKAKLQEAVLNDPQVQALLRAIFSTAPPLPVFNCYDPHHIFIFFAGEKPVGAFEVCFLCHGAQTWPDKYMKVTESYPMLRKLCMELGLESPRL